MNKSEIVACWKDAFSLLLWKESKLIILAALNNVKRSVLILVKKFWWLLGLEFILLAYKNLTALDIDQPLLTLKPILIVFFLVALLMIVFDYVLFLTIRTSLEPKDCTYYVKYIYKIPGLLITQLGIMFLLSLLHIPYAIISFLLNPNTGYNGHTLENFIIFWGMFITVPASLFYLDIEEKAIRTAIKKAFLFFFYFFPLMISIAVFLFAPLLLVSARFFPSINLCVPSNHAIVIGTQIHFWTRINFIKTSAFFLNWLPQFIASFFVDWLMLLIALCLISTVYTKLKHSHHQLLFD